MVKKFFSALTREVGGLHNAAYLLAFFTILSQLLALFRDRLFAHYFGAGAVLDVYYAAFKIPDLIFVTVASFVSISVLIPFIMEGLERKSPTLRPFLNSLFSFFFLIILAVSLIVYILTPFLTGLLFPGFSEDARSHLEVLTRIMLLSPIFLGISNFLASITQAFKRFLVYAVSPLLYNLGIIIGIVFFYPFFGVAGLAWGVVLGALCHLLVQVPFVRRQGFLPQLTLGFRFADIKDAVKLSIGRTLALATSHIASVALVAFGSFMAVGSIAVFNLSWNMQSVPLAIVGASYSIALFPTVSRFFASGERDKFVHEMLSAARHIVFWSMPVMVLFIVLRAQIVRTILGAGEFSWSNTRLVAASLALFSISVVAQSLVLLFVRAYYASGRTKVPLIINSVSSVLIIVLSFVLWKLFAQSDMFRYFFENLLRVEGIAGTEVLMLSLGYSLGMLVNLFLFMVAFSKEAPNFLRPLLTTLFQSFSSAVIMGVVAYLGLQYWSRVFDLDTVVGIFSQGLLSGIGGIIAGIIILRALESKELQEVGTTLHGKIWKTKVIVSEQEGLQ